MVLPKISFSFRGGFTMNAYILLLRTFYLIAFCIMAAVSVDGQLHGPSEGAKLHSIRQSAAISIDESRYYSDEVISEGWEHKLDPGLRLLIRQTGSLNKSVGTEWIGSASAPLSIHYSGPGEPMVDVFIQTDGTQPGGNSGLEILSQVGNIYAARVPVSSLELLGRDQSTVFIEASARRERFNDSGRIDIGAHQVHQGVDLPAGYRGEGVVVGVLDSGIDFTHPDFSNDNGTRIQFLAEYTSDSFSDWNKSQIDSNPGSVTQRDLDDGGGHGTHVTGSAAGGGKVNSNLTGVAPDADIIFVKGMIDGGFSDNVVLAGCQYIFEKADQLGKPAVINLSLGGVFGPLDGTTLYEQALSNLTGPGKIIVAAAGNSGFDLMHAGAQLPASATNVTIFLPDNPSAGGMEMWYKPGVVSQVAVGAFIVDDEQDIIYLGNTNYVPVGGFMNYTALQYEDFTLGYVGIDAGTTSDPRNGDGHIFIQILGDPDNNVNLNEVYWVIIYDSNTSGQFDMWVRGGELWPSVVGFGNVNEVPGNTHSTIGSPATAEKVIAVGSYVTKNSWTDIDGIQRQWLNPHPNRDPEQSVVAQIGQRSYFSSTGPTRDGRIAPDISAPGELIFSSLSSHLTEGQGYLRGLVLQGGNYLGMQGTSMASPHLTGVVALMLQVDPTLTYESVLQILQETARTDAHTGVVPNNLFGSGKVDAHAAIKKTLELKGVDPGTPTVLRRFDPASTQRVWTLDTTAPIDSGFVFGTNFYGDKAKATVFSLPDGMTQSQLTEVKVWFGYKRQGLTNQTYSLEVYNGTAASGPTGTPLYSVSNPLSGINADDNFQTQSDATVYTINPPVSVGSTFFVSVNFGDYGAADYGSAAVSATDQIGSRVAEVWEQWSDDSWHNVSDEWTGSQSIPGTGTAGWHLWMEATIGTATAVDDRFADIPHQLVLEPNYPNPFNPSTVIRFGVPAPGHVRMTVYDMLGREIAQLVDDELGAGMHSATFDASAFSSGVYFYRLQMDNQSRVRKMMLVR
jgi:minor extracellular serine protease Vpr